MAETSRTVAHALEVLGCFGRGCPSLNASEIARKLALPRTNVLRLLTTLEEHGFLCRDAGGGYQIGLRAFEIGTLYLAANPLSAILMGALDRLVEKTQCTAYLAILDGPDIVMLSYREGTQPIRFLWREGDRLPASTTALGKAMLSHFSEEQVQEVIGTGGSLPGLTDRSLRTLAELKADLCQARAQGWAVAREESHAGVSAVGCAILDGSNRVIAAISVSFFDYPPDASREGKLGEIVRAEAGMVNKQVAQYASYGIGLSPKGFSYRAGAADALGRGIAAPIGSTSDKPTRSGGTHEIASRPRT